MRMKKSLCINRFRQIWCPGSSFKPVVGAIGLESGAIDPEENEKGEGLHWQKDSSWGSYYVTTLHTYEPVNLVNPLHLASIYSAFCNQGNMRKPSLLPGKKKILLR